MTNSQRRKRVDSSNERHGDNASEEKKNEKLISNEHRGARGEAGGKREQGQGVYCIISGSKESSCRRGERKLDNLLINIDSCSKRESEKFTYYVPNV